MVTRQDLINLLIEVIQGMADGESIVLYYTPSQLVGQYFEVV